MPALRKLNRRNVALFTLGGALLTSACAVEGIESPGSGGSGGSTQAGVGGAMVAGAGAGATMNNGGSGGAAMAGKGGSAGSGTAGMATGGVAGQSAGGSGGATGGISGSGAAGRAGGENGGAGASGKAGAGGGANAGTSGSGSGTAGAGGSGGAMASTGCGATTWPSSDRYTIDVEGASREYILDVPADYDPSNPYLLIFGWHWRGGQASDVAGNGLGGGSYYGLESRAAGSAIFVAPEGLDNGWANPGGDDITFLRAMLDRFRAELCIDESRIFSTGFSYGGMMSLAVGCAMGDVFRAIAPMSGAFYSGCENGDSPVAFWGSHGDNDTVVPLGDGEEGRDEFLARNGCDTQTMPVDPSPCVTYQGCTAGYPVTWCEFSGGHSSPSFSGDALWNFFSQF